MKNNHIQTAIKALKRAREKYQIDHDRFQVAENSARQSKEMMAAEILKLDRQIADHEGKPQPQNELALS